MAGDELQEKNKNVEPGAAQRLSGDPKGRQSGNALHCIELEADCCAVLSASPTGDDDDDMMNSISRRPSNECKEMHSGAAAIRLLGGKIVPCAGCSSAVTGTAPHGNQSPARRLGALVAKELQRRRGDDEEGVTLQETEEDLDHDDYHHRSLPNCNAEVEAAGKLTTQHGFRGCAPNFFAKLKILDFYGGLDPTSPLEGDAFHEMSSTGCQTQNDGAPADSV